MRIEEIRPMDGPNIYNHKPVLVMRLDLEDLADTESYEVPGFVGRLRELLPGIHDHHCAMGRPGGFIERLYGGTYFGHIVEHVALELTGLAEVPAYFGKTLETNRPGVYNLIVEYKAKEATRYLLTVAVQLVSALTQGHPFELEPHLARARDIAAVTELGPSSQMIVEAARRRGIPVRRLNNAGLLELGTGRYRKRVQATMTENTSAVGVDICADKELTKELLREAMVPVPFGGVADTERAAVGIFRELGTTVAVKPLDGNHGRGVSLNLKTERDVRRAFALAATHSDQVLVEEYMEGRNYRLLVVQGKLIAAAERIAAHVVGDGTSSIRELIEITNREPDRGVGHEKPLTKIIVDPIVIATLAGQKRTLDDVPAAGEMVYLRDSANMSTGGIALDVTDDVHEDYRMLSLRVAQAVGLDVCGIDLVSLDIAAPMDRMTTAVIEVNAAPGIRMHHFPSVGKARDVGAAIVEALYPPRTQARVPVISITGTNGKTTTTRMIGQVMRSTGKCVGMTTTDGIYIGDTCILRGDTTGPGSARAVLSDPAVDVAVLETARGGIVRGGLGYDMADVAVVTNISADHIGQDGITSMKDLVHIKSLVAECVYPGGTVVLSADDPEQVQFAARLKSKIVYVSLRADHPVLERHRANGGTVFFWRDGWIVEASDREWKIVESREIPVTLQDSALFHVANALAATAACRAQGLSRTRIARALCDFRATVHNPGRSNLYDMGNRRFVLVDYGHNSESFHAIGRLSASMGLQRTIGVVGVPGDRANHIIQDSARVAAMAFDRIIVREDYDLRGRMPGEVAKLIADAVRECSPPVPTDVVLDVNEALLRAVNELSPNEMAVVFYEKLEPLLEALARLGAMPCDFSELVEPVATAPAMG